MGEEIIQGLGGKFRRKETTGKTVAEMGGRVQNGSWRDSLGGWSGFSWLNMWTADGLL
jgi:hypothetical protein